MQTPELHQRALVVASDFRKSEIELIEILQQIEERKIHFALGFSSLFQYCVDALELTEANAYNFIAVARKAKEIPRLKECLRSGELNVAKARKVLPVLTKENQSEWISKATSLPKQELEKEIARLCPEAANEKPFVKEISETKAKISLQISTETLRAIRRLQVLLCNKRRANVGIDQALEWMAEEMLNRFDPLRKKLRKDENINVNVKQPVHGQAILTIGAALRNTVLNRDAARCTFVSAIGVRCRSEKQIDIHHVRPKSEGGENVETNLTTLCRAHHQLLHVNRDAEKSEKRHKKKLQLH